MIIVNDCKVEFSSMGLFDFDGDWIHPKIACTTYELIFVVSGEVFISEETDHYHLKKGDLILLDKDTIHYGTKKSTSHTSFYWLHFNCNNIDKFLRKKVYSLDTLLTERTMKELSHLFESQRREEGELSLVKFFFDLEKVNEYKNPYAYEIAEFIRINRNKPLSVGDLSNQFGYNPDYISKIIKKEFGDDAKTFIIKNRLEFIKSLLMTTNYSISEISKSAGFENENYFSKFFKYHTKITPSAYRKKHFLLHMNNK